MMNPSLPQWCKAMGRDFCFPLPTQTRHSWLTHLPPRSEQTSPHKPTPAKSPNVANHLGRHMNGSRDVGTHTRLKYNTIDRFPNNFELFNMYFSQSIIRTIPHSIILLPLSFIPFPDSAPDSLNSHKITQAWGYWTLALVLFG